MTESDDRKYFVVKHGLDAFDALPGYIWNSVEETWPRGFRQVREGDRWIAFAYTNNNRGERVLSQVAGFYECIRPAKYGRLPRKITLVTGPCSSAWQIAGKPYGPELGLPVGVPSIGHFLDEKIFTRATISEISEREFERVRAYALENKLDHKRIPLLSREPTCEQELLALVIYAHKQLGINEIVRVRKAFPDLLVILEGSSDQVHLELELYSSGFLSHGHHRCVGPKCRFKEDGKPVAVLCWINDDTKNELRPYVHRVFELQRMIRDRQKIRW